MSLSVQVRLERALLRGRLRQVVRSEWRVLAVGAGLVCLMSASGLVLPLLSKYWVDGANRPNSMPTFLVIATLGFAGALLQAASAAVTLVLLGVSGLRFARALRTELHDTLLGLPMTTVWRSPLGEMASKLTGDVEAAASVVGSGLMQFSVSILTASMCLVAMMYVDWRATLAILPVAIISAVSMAALIRRAMQGAGRRTEASGAIVSQLLETCQGLGIIKAHAADPARQQAFAQADAVLFERSRLQMVVHSQSAALGALSSGAIASIVLWLGGMSHAAGRITVGELVVLGALSAVVLGPITHLLGISRSLSEGLAGMKRLSEFAALSREGCHDARADGPCHLGALVVDGVGFEYETGRSVLTDISFSAMPGAVVAILGPSGSGKTTLINLLLGFLSPTTGRITIGGADLGAFTGDSDRQHVGYVSQEPFLFSGTIRDNILLGREATPQMLATAVRQACCDEFVDALPARLDTVVRGGGSGLSIGQRQRITVARALLAGPRLLILDEPTSSLDASTEAALLAEVLHPRSNRITIVVTHRLATVAQADVVVVIDAGRLIECGTHEALMLAGGAYARMMTQSASAIPQVSRRDSGPERQGRVPLDCIARFHEPLDHADAR